MSIVTTLSAPPPVGFTARLQGRAAVLAATLLARRTPAQLRAVLTRLAAGARPATTDEARRALAAVLAASRRCRGQRACRVRALATVLLCRRQGTWATWCVGVRAGPLSAAHAWVEADGLPVGEPPGTADAYRKILTVEVPT